jgi:hypothetical protein
MTKTTTPAASNLTNACPVLKLPLSSGDTLRPEMLGSNSQEAEQLRQKNGGSVAPATFLIVGVEL